MRTAVCLFVALLAFSLSSCHRPVAYFQRTPYTVSRLSAEPKQVDTARANVDLAVVDDSVEELEQAVNEVALVQAKEALPAEPAQTRLARRVHRMQSLLAGSTETTAEQPQPKPKPKNQLRLGNRIRQGLGIPLREELNWWQRISWKLKASVIVILIAVLFAILHITILAIIFGVVGAFLLISGLRKSFKVRRPWF